MTTVRREILLIAACAGIFVFGIVLALLGTLFGLPGMRERLGIGMAGQGDLFLVLFFGVLVSTLIAGPTIDRYGNKMVLVFSSAAVAAALGGFVIAHSFAVAAGAALLIGVGGGGLNTSTNVLVSDLYGEQRGPMLNILGIFFGFGALCMPFLAASLAATFTIDQLLMGAATPALLASAAFAMLTFPRAREAHGFSFREVLRGARHRGVLWIAFLLFFASGIEASVGGWTTTYLTQQGTSAQTATWILAGFWGCLMVGRLVAAQLLRWIRKERLVFLSGMGAVAGCSLLALSGSLTGRAAGVLLAGLSFAAIFPTTLAIAGDRYSRFAGSVFSVLFAVALLGGMSFPWAIGRMASMGDLQTGMFLPVLGAAMISFLAMVVEKMGKAEIRS